MRISLPGLQPKGFEAFFPGCKNPVGSDHFGERLLPEVLLQFGTDTSSGQDNAYYFEILLKFF